MRVIGRTTDHILGDIEARDMPAVEKMHDPQHFTDDFGADPVTGQDQNFAV